MKTMSEKSEKKTFDQKVIAGKYFSSPIIYLKFTGPCNVVSSTV